MHAFDEDDPVLSPCVSICKMDPRAGTAAERAAGGLCVGCSRTIDEIIEWGRASAPRKREILAAVEMRRR
jgi:predicted Fe-S protein YdhL (DUF1289 family)